MPFHLLTKEFYTLVKQRLTPGGAVAFNVHDGTKLYISTVKTLGEVFPTRRSLSDRPRRGDRDRDTECAAAGQGDAARRAPPRCRSATSSAIPLPEVLQAPHGQSAIAEARGGELITDDFAPVNLYDTIGREQRPEEEIAAF